MYSLFNEVKGGSHMKLRFFISEYVDGNLEIETKHMHYAFRDDLNFDDFKPERLNKIMKKITNTCKSEGLVACFEMV